MTNMERRVYPTRQVVFFVVTFFWEYLTLVCSNPQVIFGEQVVSEMREIVSKDNQNLTSNSFLLDDDLR